MFLLKLLHFIHTVIGPQPTQPIPGFGDKAPPTHIWTASPTVDRIKQRQHVYRRFG
jgi:hypothetical protein